MRSRGSSLFFRLNFSRASSALSRTNCSTPRKVSISACMALAFSANSGLFGSIVDSITCMMSVLVLQNPGCYGPVEAVEGFVVFAFGRGHTLPPWEAPPSIRSVSPEMNLEPGRAGSRSLRLPRLPFRCACRAQPREAPGSRTSCCPDSCPYRWSRSIRGPRRLPAPRRHPIPRRRSE